MTRVLHVIIGPAGHGVVQHATAVGSACADEAMRFEQPSQAHIPAGYDVVHIPYTDRLFGPTCEASATEFERLASAVKSRGSRLSITLHDIPAGTAALDLRRRAAYQRVVASAAGIVVSSHHERAVARHLTEDSADCSVIPLPVVCPDPSAGTVRPAPSGTSVAVLGFIYPDRGYEQVLDGLPSDCELVALGRAADGHENLPDQIAAHAARVERSWRMTGYLTQEALAEQLRTIAVPVAPNRRVGASASIATWLAHGRRPLVAAGAYAEEIAACWPRAVQLYDPDRPDALERAIRHALESPASTVLERGVVAGPTMDEVATAYTEHFAVIHRIPAAGGTSLHIPGNRWDLLDGRWPAAPPTVSVVIPYFESQRQLDLVLTGLSLQKYPAGRLQVIVADDGSRLAPDLSAAGELDCLWVRQPNLGFRAAAARNLGAASAEGDVLAFLDGDTVPEPDYLCQLSRLPALAAQALVVGRRRHADFGDWDGDALALWLTGLGERSPREFTEPEWLVDGYRRSRDLLDVDARSYRYVISAVMATSREFFSELGGFCEDFTSYGGEDWELAYRAYNAGALMAHEPRAIAWHDGPQWAEREGDQAAAKATEERMLKRLIPDREARGPGQWMPYPAIVVRMPGGDPAAVIAASQSAFRSGADCGFWIEGLGACATAHGLADPRIQLGPPSAGVLARARVVVDLTAPTDLSALARLSEIAEINGDVFIAAGRVRSTRRAHRRLRDFGAGPVA